MSYNLKQTFTVGLASLLLLLGGCSTEEENNTSKKEVKEEVAAEKENTSDTEEKEKEKDGFRLIVGFNGGVALYDQTFNVVNTFETNTNSFAFAADQRHVFLNNREAGEVKVLDVGVWNESHGDHGHFHEEDAEVYSYILTGNEPTHFVSHAGRTAIFNDGDGSVNVFDTKSLESELPEALFTYAGVGHHGVAVPLSNGSFLVSYTDEVDPQPLPNGVALIDKDGVEIKKIEKCPGLHGEASIGKAEEEVIAFGCKGSVLMYLPSTDEEINVTLPNENARVGTIKSNDNSKFMLTNYSSEEQPELNTNVGVIDTVTREMKLVELGTKYAGAMAIGANDKGYVLGVDGKVYTIQLATGEILEKAQVVEAFELEEGHGHGAVYPSLTVVEDHVYVVDPVKNTLLELHGDHADTLVELEFQPTSIIGVRAY